MEKDYQFIEANEGYEFQKALNDLSGDGYAVVSHAVTVLEDDGKYYTAIMVKYNGKYSSTDYIQDTLSKLDSIESNTSNIS